MLDNICILLGVILGIKFGLEKSLKMYIRLLKTQIPNPGP